MIYNNLLLFIILTLLIFKVSTVIAITCIIVVAKLIAEIWELVDIDDITKEKSHGVTLSVTVDSKMKL